MKKNGFTLIELMITVAVVAILAAIAEGSYSAYVQRGYRAEAKSILMQDASMLERNFTTSNRYDQDGAGNATNALIQLQSPGSGTAIYNISVAYTATPAMDFTLTATPVASGPMATDSCGSLTLTNTGTQGVTGTASVASCWSK